MCNLPAQKHWAHLNKHYFRLTSDIRTLESVYNFVRKENTQVVNIIILTVRVRLLTQFRMTDYLTLENLSRATPSLLKE